MLAFAENFMNENSEEESARVIRETNKLESATQIFSSGWVHWAA